MWAAVDMWTHSVKVPLACSMLACFSSATVGPDFHSPDMWEILRGEERKQSWACVRQG